MPAENYHYRAINAQNRVERGILTTHHIDELHRHLQQNNLVLLDYHIKKPANSHFLQRSSPQELIEFCFYLTQLLRAGISLIDSLQQLTSAITNPYFRNVINHLVKSMAGGECLSVAMRQFPSVFDKVFIQLIQVGEQSGQLPTILEHLTDTLTWKQSIRQAIKKAVLYPAFLFSLILLIIVFILYWLVPQLVEFIQGFNIPLPWQTQMLINISTWLQNYGLLLLFVIVTTFTSLVILIRRYLVVRCLYDAILLKTWGIGGVLQQLMLARFSRFFALMYQSGLPILDVLQLLRGTLGNCVMEKALIEAHTYIMAGDSISEGFKKTHLFSDFTLRMLSVGETTGGLDTALYHVSDFYQKKAQYQLEKFQALLEPALTVFLAMVLGGLMLSVLQPIYELMGNLNP